MCGEIFQEIPEVTGLFGVETTRTKHSTQTESQTQSVRSAEREAAGWSQCETACKMQKHHSCDCLVHEVAAKFLKNVCGCSYVIMVLIHEVNSMTASGRWDYSALIALHF